MLACGRCMRSGKILHRFDDEGSVEAKPPPMTVGGGEEIIEGYGKIIRAAREKAGIPTSVVAERIKEKENYIKAIEQGRFMPTIEVARKLEKELNIKLVEKVEKTVAPSVSGKAGFAPPTLADMIEPKKKKK
ncbi:MAG: helix-turn-helix domain-containing protein, partial [Candidatus Micrarchaeota archaeon]